jgi:exopolyphosphatase/guanosine-5'-triphosphate,3'-diphosphate pyrophosphatase
MKRFATIDIGTNSVLLLVAERRADGNFVPVAERAEITRLGRGVDRAHRLSAQGMEDTLAVVAQFAAEARAAGAAEIAVSATSAARDAQNGADFLRVAEGRAGVAVEVISGDREAQLTFLAVSRDFGPAAPDRPLVMIDIGGGSTELVYGAQEGEPGAISYRRSFDVGSVRLTERFIHSDPVREEERQRVLEHLSAELTLPAPPDRFRAVGVAGTVTTLYALLHQVEPYDASRVHGQTISLRELQALSQKLCATPLAARKQLPGLQPKRADVICAGALILESALLRLGATSCLVSDRGLRWGLLLERFG